MLTCYHRSSVLCVRYADACASVGWLLRPQAPEEAAHGAVLREGATVIERTWVQAYWDSLSDFERVGCAA